MRVLVTRPEPSAAATAGRVSALGHRPVLLPLSRAVHDRPAALAALAGPFDALVVTSAEAFRALGEPPPGVAAHRIFCVGPATAAAAARAGFTQIVTAQGTGLSLAARILAEPPCRLLYLAGEPRSPDLEEQLAAAGVPLSLTVCYRMEPVGHDAAKTATLLADPVPEAVLLFSRESALHFFRLPAVAADPARFSGTLFLCISQKTARAVPAACAARVAVAETPDEAGLLALLPPPSSQN